MSLYLWICINTKVNLVSWNGLKNGVFLPKSSARKNIMWGWVDVADDVEDMKSKISIKHDRIMAELNRYR